MTHHSHGPRLAADARACTAVGCVAGVLTLHYVLDDDGPQRVMTVACPDCHGTGQAQTPATAAEPARTRAGGEEDADARPRR